MPGIELPFSAFILAGGLGKRLQSVVFDRPKPLAMVNDKPFLEILIESLAHKGVRDFVLLTGYKGDMIENHFMRQRKLNIRFSHELAPLGTGGAVKNAEEFATDPTLLVNGDTFFDANLEKLHRFHLTKRAGVTLSLVRAENVGRYGSVIIDKNDFVTGFCEKSQESIGPGFINAGLSLLSLKAIRNLPFGKPFSMENEIFPLLAQSREMAGFYQDRPFFDIGTPESYDEFKIFVKKSTTESSQSITNIHHS
ncbi:MAG: nucleotidyltransferase family protein [Desulfomonile sp.]